MVVPPLYLDQDISGNLVQLLRQSGHDVLTASDIGLAHAGDHEHVAAAATGNRVLVTYNARDFRLLHDAWRRWTGLWGISKPHAGILIILQPPTWTSARAAKEIVEFFTNDPVIENELYEWRRGSRQWERRVAAHHASW